MASYLNARSIWSKGLSNKAPTSTATNLSSLPSMGSMFTAPVISPPYTKQVMDVLKTVLTPKLESIPSYTPKSTSDFEPQPTPEYTPEPRPEPSPGPSPSTAPSQPRMSVEEMMEIVNRRVGLMVDPELEALTRALEEAYLAAEQQRGGVSAGYGQAMEDLERMTQGAQRTGSETMVKRGLYDSGLALDLATRVGQEGQRLGAQIGGERARALESIEKDLAQREKFTTEQKTSLEGRRGELAADLLAEMQRYQEEQAFNQSLALRQQALQEQLGQWRMSQPTATYREPDYETILANQAYQKLLEGAGFGKLTPEEQWAIGYQPETGGGDANYQKALQYAMKDERWNAARATDADRQRLIEEYYNWLFPQMNYSADDIMGMNFHGYNLLR